MNKRRVDPLSRNCPVCGLVFPRMSPPTVKKDHLQKVHPEFGFEVVLTGDHRVYQCTGCHAILGGLNEVVVHYRRGHSRPRVINLPREAPTVPPPETAVTTPSLDVNSFLGSLIDKLSSYKEIESDYAKLKAEHEKVIDDYNKLKADYLALRMNADKWTTQLVQLQNLLASPH